MLLSKIKPNPKALWQDQNPFNNRTNNPISRNVLAWLLSQFPQNLQKLPVTLKAHRRIDDHFYKDIAEVQFYCGARIGEVAGIQIKNIDLKKRILTINEVITWLKGVPTVRKVPKNGKSREVYVNDALLAIFKRRMKDKNEGCPFLFHDEGKPLRYNRINQNYNRAWKDAGLARYSGTHQVRYAAAQAARKLTQSVSAVASVTGHQSRSMAEKYSAQKSIDLNRTSLVLIEKHLSSERLRAC